MGMSFHLEIIRAAEFVCLGAEGRFDLAASKTALATVAASCRKRGIQHAVLDLRALQPGPEPIFTPADLLELVNTFPEAGFTRELRLAILYRSDPHRRARLFAFLSTLHGWCVRAFGDFEHALLWLSSGPASAAPAPRSSTARTIPIRACGQTRNAGGKPRSPLRRPRSGSAKQEATRPN